MGSDGIKAVLAVTRDAGEHISAGYVMIDRHSDTWREVAAWALNGVSKASERIETLGVEPAETENLRGRIGTLRELLAMQDEPEQRVIETPEDYGFQGYETD